MTDEANYGHPRLAAIYDPLDPDRGDLEVYADIVAEFGAQRVLDIGCGTGVFALLLAARGVDVIGVEPARASLDVARAKPGAEQVRWLDGDARVLSPLDADLAIMTANVAQAIVNPTDWDATLSGTHLALRPGGRLVFETRVPARRGWEEWTRDLTYKTTDIDGVGTVTAWCEVTDIALPLLQFRWTYEFASDGAVMTSDSTLRFRERDEVAADLERHGFVVDEVREALDRPGREFVFVASAV